MEIYKKQVGIFECADGTPLYYEVRGQGTPVVLVYGIACLMNHWHHQVRYFSNSMQTVVYDLRGHHRSQPVTDHKNLSMTQLSNDLVFLMEKLEIKKAHFVGHSFGVPILIEAYKNNPEMFLSMAYINGFSQNPIENMFGLNIVEPFFHFVSSAYEKAPDLWSTLWRLAVDNPVSMRLAAIAGGFNLSLTHFEDIEVYARGVAHMELPVFLELFRSMMEFNASDVLPHIKVPVLVIVGENDRVTPKHLQEKFKSMIPNVEYLEVPYGSHCTQLDFPDYVNLRLREFWSRTT